MTNSHNHYTTARKLRDSILDRRFNSRFTATETRADWQAVVDECDKAVSALYAEMGNRVHGRSQFSFLDLVDIIRSPARGQVQNAKG